MSAENQEETLGFLRSHGLAYVCVDMPQGYPSSIPPVLAVTSDELAVVRMHGHSSKWDSKDIYERFGYQYSEAEISEWAPRVRDLAAGASVTQVLFNNCYRNYAQVNAEQLQGLLLDDDLEGEPGRAAAADERATRARAGEPGGGCDRFHRQVNRPGAGTFEINQKETQA